MDSPPAVWSRIRNWIWEAGLLLVLPLAFYRGYAEQFSTPKFFLAKCLLISGLAVWAIGLIWRPRTRPKKFSLGLPLLAFGLAVLLSCLNSPSPRFSILEAEFALCGPTWVLLLVSWERGESAVRRIAILTASGGAAVAAITLLQRMGYDPVLLGGYQVEWGTMVERMRLYSTFGNPNFVGGYLIGAVFPALALGAVSRARWAKGLWFGIAFVMSAATAETGSHGAWVGLAAGFAVASLLLMPRSGLLRLRQPLDEAATRTCIAPLWPTALLALTLAERLAAQLHGRVYLWRFSWPMFWEHPLLGSGWGAYQLLYLELQARFLAAHPEYVGYWTNNRLLHNDPLQLLLEAGLGGFAAFLWILWNYAQEANRLLGQSAMPWTRYAVAASAGGVTAILTDSLFNYQFAVPPTFILLFTLLAFPALLRDREISEDPTTPPLPLLRASWPWIVKAMVCLLILAAAAGLLRHETRLLLSERAYQTATVLEDQNDLRDAEEAYRQSIALDLLNGRAHFGLSRVLYETNHFPEALREVVRGEQTYADSHQEVLRARILEQMNNRAEALAAYRHALWLDATLTTPQESIQRLSKAH